MIGNFKEKYLADEKALQEAKLKMFSNVISATNQSEDISYTQEVKKKRNVSLDNFEFEEKSIVSKYLDMPSFDDLISCKSDKADKNTRQSHKIKKAKKKEKKRKKNLKKNKKEFNETLSIFLEDKGVVEGALMAKLMKNAECLCVQEKELKLYDDKTGIFISCNEDDFSVRLNSILDDELKLKIKSKEYAETYNQIMKSEELIYDKGYFENKPFVNCLNGVIDVLTGELLPHEPKYHFKHCINARYIPGSKPTKYLKFLNNFFGGDKELIHLWQVAQGYITSHYNNAKIAFLLIGKSHTGKSVLHVVIENIIGKGNTAHVDLSFLYKQEYAASIKGKLLNIAPDLKNVPLKDVGFFKSLVSHDDTISTRALYKNPGDMRGDIKMFYTTNHPITFNSSVDENDIQAVFNRLLYLPVQCKPIDETIENKHMSEELFEERDAIFTWGIEGLKKYVESGERFPKSKLSEQAKCENMAKYCTEKVFFDKYIKEVEGQYESVTAIKEAYARFCSKNKSPRMHSITDYIEDRLNIEKIKKRIDNEGYSKKDGIPIYVYPNIRIKEKYR